MAGVSARILASLQALIAICLPLGLVLWAPGDPRVWAIAVLLGEITFAIVRRGFTWIAPIVAACVFIPLFLDLGELAEPWLWGSVTLTVGSAIALAALALLTPTGAPSAASQLALIAAISLAVTAVFTGGLAAWADWRSNQQFAVGQAAAASAFPDAPQEPIGQDDGTDPIVITPDATSEPAPEFTPEATSATPEVSAAPPAPPGTALARISFSRPDTGELLVTDETLIVREGVDSKTLAKGPGRYPATAPIGAPGNVAIAGHRTGWGSPFLRLDELQPGDAIDLTGPDGTTSRYLVERSELVAPDAAWVLGPDPLGSGGATLTLTTCDPPHSDDRRLVVFATLDTGSGPSEA